MDADPGISRWTTLLKLNTLPGNTMPDALTKQLKIARICNYLVVGASFGLICCTLSLPPIRTFLFDLLGEESLPELSAFVFRNLTLFTTLAGGWMLSAIAAAWRFHRAATPASITVAISVGIAAQAVLTMLGLGLPFVKLVQAV